MNDTQTIFDQRLEELKVKQQQAKEAAEAALQQAKQTEEQAQSVEKTVHEQLQQAESKVEDASHTTAEALQESTAAKKEASATQRSVAGYNPSELLLAPVKPPTETVASDVPQPVSPEARKEVKQTTESIRQTRSELEKAKQDLHAMTTRTEKATKDHEHTLHTMQQHLDYLQLQSDNLGTDSSEYRPFFLLGALLAVGSIIALVFGNATLGAVGLFVAIIEVAAGFIYKRQAI